MRDGVRGGRSREGLLGPGSKQIIRWGGGGPRKRLELDQVGGVITGRWKDATDALMLGGGRGGWIFAGSA
jgi:hypothetical protein